MNITLFTANQLYSLGFKYPYYENNVNRGMVFSYDGEEWIIGGNDSRKLSGFDLELIDKGVWLPGEDHLMEWLKGNDFIFAIECNSNFFDITCKDEITGREYSTSMPTLVDGLAVIIKKILKKKERELIPRDKESYEIIE